MHYTPYTKQKFRDECCLPLSRLHERTYTHERKKKIRCTGELSSRDANKSWDFLDEASERAPCNRVSFASARVWEFILDVVEGIRFRGVYD